MKHTSDVDFEQEILPILRRSCLPCHNSSHCEMILETPQTILKGGASGPVVVPGKSAESLLLKLASQQDDPVMPPKDNKPGAPKLTPQELGLLRLWIDQGAKGQVLGSAGPVTWQPLPPGIHPIYAAAISPDGQTAAAGRANQIVLYHVPSKRELGRLTDPSLLPRGLYDQPGVAHLDLVQSLAFSPDGETLASGAFREVKLWRRLRNARKAAPAGLDGPAQSLAVSRDGRWAAVGQENGKIVLFDLAAGKAAQMLTGHTAAATSVVFSADGAKLVSASHDKSFRVWNLSDGQQVAAIETPVPVAAVAWVDHEQLIATAGQDNLIRLWALSGEARPVKELTGHSGPVTSLAAIAPHGTQLVSGSQDGTVRVWDVNVGTQVRQMDHGGPVEAVTARGDGQRIASAGATTAVKLWNTATGQVAAELKGDFRTRLAAERAAQAVALARKAAEAFQRDVAEAHKRQQSELEHGKKAEEALKSAQEEFAKKDEAAKKLLADKEAADKKLEVAKATLAKAEEAKKAADEAAAKATDEAAKKIAEEARQKAEQESAAAQAEFKKLEADAANLAGPAKKALDERIEAERKLADARRTLERSQQSIREATEAVPKAEAAVKAAEEKLKQQEAAAAAASQAAAASEKPWRTVAFSPDGATVAAIGADQHVFTWDTESGAALDAFAGPGTVAPLLAFDAGQDVVTVIDNTLVIWNVRAGWRLERTIGSPDAGDALIDRVTALAFSRDGKRLATGSGEPSRSGQLKLWDAESGSLVREFSEPHSDTILAVEFSHDNRHLATCSADRFMKVFEVETGKLVRAFEGHTHHVLGVSWSADDRTLATGGADKVIKVWDFLSGDQKRTLPGFSKEVTAVRFVAATSNVLASCGDQVVYLKQTGDGNTLRTYAGARDFVFSVDVSADGQTLLAGSQDGALRIWSENGQLLAAFEPDTR